MPADKTVILKTTPFRRRARQWERAAQQYLRGIKVEVEKDILAGLISHPWVKGVRVQKAGLFNWAVVGTERRGH